MAFAQWPRSRLVDAVFFVRTWRCDPSEAEPNKLNLDAFGVDSVSFVACSFAACTFVLASSDTIGAL